MTNNHKFAREWIIYKNDLTKITVTYVDGSVEDIEIDPENPPHVRFIPDIKSNIKVTIGEK